MHVKGQDGWALVTALVLMLIISVFAAATLTLSQAESRSSAASRGRASAFNVAEAAMNAQTFALAAHWPGAGGATSTAIRYPVACTPATADARCPVASTMAQLYTGADTVRGVSWTTMVRDNSGSVGATSFWSESMQTTAPSYDANGDGEMWVRSQAVTAGHARTIVSLAHVELDSEALPHATLLAGRLAISNLGKKTIIDTAGSSASTGQLAVRCTPQAGEQTACLGHPLSSSGNGQQKLKDLLDVQISPNVSTTGYTGTASLSADALERIRQTAISAGTYFTTCPATLTGAVVFIATTANCAYTANAVYNSPTAPGFLVMTSGSLTLGGTSTFNGVIYHANQGASTATNLVDLEGNTTVVGGVIIDGAGGLVAGSSKANIQYSDQAFSAVRSNGTAGLVQNTWREIRGT